MESEDFCALHNNYDIVLPVRPWQVIIILCVLLLGSLDAFALRLVHSGTPCTGDFGGTVSRARYYSPQIGRFWTADDGEQGNQETPKSLHLFTYCEGDPINNLDPSGRDISELGLNIGLSFAFAQVPTIKSAIQTVPVQIVTIIRPPDMKDGVKTRHVVAVDGFGSIASVQRFIGTTPFRYAAPNGRGRFSESASSDFPVTTVYMGAEARTVALPPRFSIRYGFEIKLDFRTRTGHLSGFHETYPSYTVTVKGKQVYDFQQQKRFGLAGFNLQNPEVDFAW